METRGNSSPRQICYAVMPAAHHVVRSRGLPGATTELIFSAGTQLTQAMRRFMQKPPPNPDVADEAPVSNEVTLYDEEHIITCLRLLDANAEGADWKEVARIVLHIDPDREPGRARRAWETHLARAQWMSETGYRHLLRGGASNPHGSVPARKH